VLDFQPVFKPRAGFLRPCGDDTFRELGAITRTSILLLSVSKSKLVKAAAYRGEDEWYRMLDDLDGASEIPGPLSKFVEMAYARGITAAAVLATKEH
jgi:hypothetical protein